MVQTEDQYSFIHEALLEAVACGNTEVAARSLYSYMQKLSKVESGEHVIGMELEFKVGGRAGKNISIKWFENMLPDIKNGSKKCFGLWLLETKPCVRMCL